MVYFFFQPCISVGNVGQLAVDLVVSTLGLQRVGWIQDTALLPIVGNDAFDHTPGRGYLHTSAEGKCRFLFMLFD